MSDKIEILKRAKEQGYVDISSAMGRVESLPERIDSENMYCSLCKQGLLEKDGDPFRKTYRITESGNKLLENERTIIMDEYVKKLKSRLSVVNNSNLKQYVVLDTNNGEILSFKQRVNFIETMSCVLAFTFQYNADMVAKKHHRMNSGNKSVNSNHIATRIKLPENTIIFTVDYTEPGDKIEDLTYEKYEKIREIMKGSEFEKAYAQFVSENCQTDNQEKDNNAVTVDAADKDDRVGTNKHEEVISDSRKMAIKELKDRLKIVTSDDVKNGRLMRVVLNTNNGRPLSVRQSFSKFKDPAKCVLVFHYRSNIDRITKEETDRLRIGHKYNIQHVTCNMSFPEGTIMFYADKIDDSRMRDSYDDISKMIAGDDFAEAYNQFCDENSRSDEVQLEDVQSNETTKPMANNEYVSNMKDCLNHFICSENDEERVQILSEIARETGRHKLRFVKSNTILNKKYEIFYNDGTYYGTMSFCNESKDEIEILIQSKINRNNKDINPHHHISRSNFKEVK